MTKTISVFVLEDHPETNARLCRIINDADRLALVGAATTLAQAKDFLDSSDTTIDVVLVDLGLPDGSGNEFIKRLQTQNPCPKALVITVFGDEKNVVSAFKAGALGYLMKEEDDEIIADWIYRVMDGQSPISPSIAHHLLKQFRQQSAANEKTDDNETVQRNTLTPSIASAQPVHLTRREKEVLEMIAKGYSYKEIAKLLEITVNTVTTHAQNIYAKLQVKSRGEAVFEAQETGLI